MAEYFAGGHLRFVNGEWRDDNGDAIEISRVRHGRWEFVVCSDGKEYMVCTVCRKQQDLTGVFSYCPNCGAKMDGGDGNSDICSKTI